MLQCYIPAKEGVAKDSSLVMGVATSMFQLPVMSVPSQVTHVPVPYLTQSQLS